MTKPFASSLHGHVLYGYIWAFTFYMYLQNLPVSAQSLFQNFSVNQNKFDGNFQLKVVTIALFY